MMPNITNFETQRVGGQILKKLNDDEVKKLSRSDRKFA